LRPNYAPGLGALRAGNLEKWHSICFQTLSSRHVLKRNSFLRKERHFAPELGALTSGVIGIDIAASYNFGATPSQSTRKTHTLIEVEIRSVP
jgi:hypothetical protein